MGNAAAVALAAVFANAALAKLANMGPIEQVIGEITRSRWSRVLAVLLVLVEMLAALSQVLAPTSLPSALLCAILSTTFLVVGVIAIRRRTQIQCACFGGGRHVLGWRQVIQFPVMIGLVGLSFEGAQWSPSSRAIVTLFALCAVATASSVQVKRGLSQLRRERLLIASFIGGEGK